MENVTISYKILDTMPVGEYRQIIRTQDELDENILTLNLTTIVFMEN